MSAYAALNDKGALVFTNALEAAAGAFKALLLQRNYAEQDAEADTQHLRAILAATRPLEYGLKIGDPVIDHYVLVVREAKTSISIAWHDLVSGKSTGWAKLDIHRTQPAEFLAALHKTKRQALRGESTVRRISSKLFAFDPRADTLVVKSLKKMRERQQDLPHTD